MILFADKNAFFPVKLKIASIRNPANGPVDGIEYCDDTACRLKV